MERNNPKIFQKKNHEEKIRRKKPQKSLSQKQLFRPSLQRNPLDILQIFAHTFFTKMGIFRAKKRRHSLCFVTSECFVSQTVLKTSRVSGILIQPIKDAEPEIRTNCLVLIYSSIFVVLTLAVTCASFYLDNHHVTSRTCHLNGVTKELNPNPNPFFRKCSVYST